MEYKTLTIEPPLNPPSPTVDEELRETLKDIREETDGMLKKQFITLDAFGSYADRIMDYIRYNNILSKPGANNTRGREQNAI